ncbi:DEAD/DEAH box helicase [Ottowia sp.]|uniref:DEAD/DEAH box helicase n=1 Tax=Ottowia sp. TaxID=1898956 RepID=UPI0025F1AE2F|nr:DEAD/DEAH box helicase [Ottowia sp.]MBK6747477.1 DEAD/DEAH box helicase family protein [Ottowia sp.]
MPFLSDADDLRGFVSSTTLDRGRALFRGRKVLECIVAEDGDDAWVADGSVQGSQWEPYDTTVRVEFSEAGELETFEGDCTCPVEVDCKHSVALALKLGEYLQSTAQRQAPSVRGPSVTDSSAMARVDQWLARFESGAAAPAPGQGDEPVYLLREKAQGPGGMPGLELAWQSARRLKRGGWSKPRQPAYGVDMHWAEQPLDGDAIRLVRALVDLRYGYVSNTQCWVRGAVGALALQACARTGRLFLTDAQGAIDGDALRWGEPRTVDWSWREHATLAGQAPLWELAPATDARIYPGPPALYLDRHTRTCGPATAPGLADAHLALLLTAPPLPAPAFTDPRNRLLTRLAAVPLPPGMQAPARWPEVTPMRRLALALTPRHDRAALGLVTADLRFDYGGLQGWWPQPDALVLAEHDGQRVFLLRDLALEDTALASLDALGLRGGGPLGRFHQPDATRWLDWAAQDWAPLRNAGFELDVTPELAALVQSADTLDVSVAEPEDHANGRSWFDLSLGLEIAGERLNVLPWLPGWLGRVQWTPDGPQLPPWLWQEREDGRWLRVPSAPLLPWLRVLLELVGDHATDGDSLRLSRLEALRLAASLGDGVAWSGAAQLRDMLGQLTGAGALPDVAVPASLQAELRPYQRQGLNWLQFLRAHHLGGVLADDMGLGKTVQTLAHLLREQEDGRLDRPCLVIAPVSLLGNWRAEAARFAPSLRTRVWHGQGRHGTAFAEDCDLLIAPYSLLQRDKERWLAQPWHIVVLDEAQHIKNATTHAAQVVSALDARQRLALTGTPLENHLGELWSLYHFLMPGFLGSHKRFGELFRTPIEKLGDTDALARLRQRVTPFMLRRTKDVVAQELPPLIESVTRVTLASKQADLYETIRLATEKAVREALAAKGLARSQIQVLDALLKLRQVCCDPRLVKTLPATAKAPASAKLGLLMELLPELLAGGRRVLLFSQFTSMLTLIEAELQAAGLAWTKLTGQTQKRDEAIARFTSGEVPLFLISLKAGGTGLNLPQADTVIHYDPWWNPAVEAQATGRAHRMGQTRQVMAYKLVAEGTIEERILALQERKAALAQGLLTGAAAREQPLFTEGDVAELLRPLGG